VHTWTITDAFLSGQTAQQVNDQIASDPDILSSINSELDITKNTNSGSSPKSAAALALLLMACGGSGSEDTGAGNGAMAANGRRPRLQSTEHGHHKSHM
jgi:hypothetical protein